MRFHPTFLVIVSLNHLAICWSVVAKLSTLVDSKTKGTLWQEGIDNIGQICRDLELEFPFKYVFGKIALVDVNVLCLTDGSELH